MVIAKLDSTKNEIEGVDIEGFPTIKMFKKETNEEIEYVGRKKIYLFMLFFLSDPSPIIGNACHSLTD